MGARLMLAPKDQCLGFEGAGDFHMDAAGVLVHRGEDASAEWAYTGAQIVDPMIIDSEPLEPFSFMRVWRRLMSEGRLYGAPLGGFWMHVGDPNAKLEAEARMGRAAAVSV
jgi:MurNAc alpha-1-phosphate uridylyltransferase